jgi:predicted dehydrogenase
MLADSRIAGVIITVPNEQHLAVAREVAKAGKHVYTEKPIASTLEQGLEIEALEKAYSVTVTVGHSARLMAGIRRIRDMIDADELGRVAFMEANFSNERRRPRACAPAGRHLARSCRREAQDDLHRQRAAHPGVLLSRARHPARNREISARYFYVAALRTPSIILLL